MLKGNFILIKAPKTNKSLSEAVAGDLLCYNNGKLYIYPSSKFEGTPIGVVVIPTSHNVYGNGSCGVMSLVNMSCDTPDTGATNDVGNIYIVWGDTSSEISSLNTYSAVVSIGNSSTISDSLQLKPYYSTTILPSDGFTAFQNPFDTDTYYNTQDESYYYIPSPYNEDDSRNPQYSQTSAPSNDTNALSDFNGKGNTIIMTDLATGQPNWKTASTIKNEYQTGYFPAACCCWRFHTLGTKQGDWYLPAIGELGYIMPKLTTIESTIQKTGIGIKLLTNGFWSSTQSEYSKSFDLDIFDNGRINPDNYRTTSNNVRAFMQAGPDIVSE